MKEFFDWLIAIIIFVPLATISILLFSILVIVLAALVGIASPVIAVWATIILAVEGRRNVHKDGE